MALPATAEQRRQSRLIIVEGNIAAGKSTLCTQLAKELGFALFLEPTAVNPYLELYYAEPKKYALALQIWILKQRYITYVNALKLVHSGCSGENVNGVILDRSIWSDAVFAMKNYQDGNISQQGFEYYCAVRKKLLQDLVPPDALLYLDVPAEECHRRVHHLRQRGCKAVFHSTISPAFRIAISHSWMK